jgi:hypothetical protein
VRLEASSNVFNIYGRTILHLPWLRLNMGDLLAEISYHGVLVNAEDYLVLMGREFPLSRVARMSLVSVSPAKTVLTKLNVTEPSFVQASYLELHALKA